MLGRERVDEIGLDLVRVLILVDEDKLELAPIKIRDVLVLLQHPQRLLKQIVEVHRVRSFLLSLVTRLHILDLFEERQEIRKLFREQCIDRRFGIDDKAENFREHVTLRKSNLLRVDPCRRDHRIDEVLLIFAIHDRESARITECAPVPPQHSIPDRMKGAAPKPAGVDREQIRDAIQHLARGFVREGEEENVPRVDSVFEQIRHAISERARLAATRARDDKKRSRRRGHRRELLLIQLRRVIDIDRGCRGSALERVFAGHGA